MTRVNVNGRIFSRSQAKISVFDRGFLYGDSIYEVLRTYGGAPFALGAHLQRLRRSAQLLGMRLPHEDGWFVTQLARTLHAAANRESYIRIVVTRGAGRIGLDPGLARNPQTLIIVKALNPPPAALYARGARVEIVSLSRGGAGSVDPAAKSGNYLASILALAEARARGAYEAILVDGRGHLSEGASSNLFVWRGRTLVTPPLSVGILQGITRSRLLGLARDLGIAVQERLLRPAALWRAQEAFVTSSIREIMPIREVGQHPRAPRSLVGDGSRTAALRQAFHERAHEEARKEWARLTRARRRSSR